MKRASTAAPLSRRPRRSRSAEWSVTRETIHDDERARQPVPRKGTEKTLIDLGARAAARPSSEAEATEHTPMPERIGPKAIAGYDVGPRTEDGGGIEVYVGEKRSSHGIVRRAVLKRIARRRADYERWRDVLLDEAMITACFAHPNLTSLVDVGESSAGAFIALEHVDGTSLERLNATLRARHRALPIELACFVIAEALRGMHYAHTVKGPDGRELGVVLRDRTPANLLISRTGHVKLCDFSLAEMKTRRRKDADALARVSPAYLAPEYLAGDPCSVRSDVYAIGVMLFELLAGRACFSAESARELLSLITERGVVWRELGREGVPDPLLEIVARATNPCPGGRYESAGEMVDALDEWLLASGRPASAAILSRALAKHDLYGGPGEESTADDRRYAPPLRIVRGASVVVREAPEPLRPPPLPPVSVVPIEERPPRPSEESALFDAFDDGVSQPGEEGGDGDGGELEDGDEVELGVTGRPPILPLPEEEPALSSPPLESGSLPAAKRDHDGRRMMIFAAAVAILVFVTILYFPT